MIADELMERFDNGRLSRRQLLQGLTLLAAATQLPATAAESATSIAARSIDHVSLLVRDLPSAAAFYQGVFGLSAVGEDKEHRILRLGKARRVIVSLRQDEPYGQIDHFGLSIEGFNKEAATKFLNARGHATKEDWEYGFYTHDPDGAVVQLL